MDFAVYGNIRVCKVFLIKLNFKVTIFIGLIGFRRLVHFVFNKVLFIDFQGIRKT